jgi:hypothetical protein
MNDDSFFMKKNIKRNNQQKAQASSIKVQSTRGQSELIDDSPMMGHVKTIMHGSGKP